MLKKFTQKVASTALALAILAGSASAQTIYWGAGSADSYIDSVGRFASTDGTLTSLGWVPDANASAAGAAWSFSMDGMSHATITAAWIAQNFTGPMTSPSIADGAAIFDSDSLAIAGVAVPHGAKLQMNNIDLSAAAGKTVAVKFYTNYFDFQTTNYNVNLAYTSAAGPVSSAISVRDLTGENGVRAAYNGWVFTKVFTLPTDPTEIDSCELSIEYLGNYYFFAVDDISIVEAPKYDLAIAVPTAGNTLGNTFTTLRISNNYTQPLSQVSEDEYGFGATVVNRSTTALDPVDNGRLVVSIDRETAPNTWTNQVIDSTMLGALAYDVDSNYVAGFSNAWVPSDTGHYRVTYTLALDSLDGNMNNNSAVHYFNISEDYYSKLPKRADGYPDYTGRSFPGASGTNVVSEFEYGSMFFFPAGDSTTRLDSVLFRLYNTTIDTANFVNTVNVRVYEYRDLDGDGVLADDPTAGEIILVALGQTTIANVIPTGYKASAAQLLNTNDGGDFFFKDTTTYLVTLDQRVASGLENPAGTRFRGFFYGSYKINYGLNAAFFNAVPSPVRAAEISNTGAPATNDWNWIGFGAYQVPSIGLALSYVVDTTINVEQNVNAVNNFRLYPNPTEENLNVAISLDAPSNVQYMITDVSGRVVRFATKQNVQNEVVTFGVRDLAAGVYFVSIKTAKGVSTQRFVKQ